MQSNIGKCIREEAVDTVQLIHSKPRELLFGTLKDNEGNDEDSALFDMLPVFNYLLSTLEKARKKYEGNTNFQASVNFAWGKLTKYYEKSDNLKVYLVASVLDP